MNTGQVHALLGTVMWWGLLIDTACAIGACGGIAIVRHFDIKVGTQARKTLMAALLATMVLGALPTFLGRVY